MGKLKAGAAKNCITPQLDSHISGYFNDRLAQDVHDDLFAKALVLENGACSLAIVICDLIDLPKADIDRAKDHASRQTGIPADHILIACTHTHNGPTAVAELGPPRDERYMAQAMERVGDSIRLAQNRLEEAEIGVAVGACPGETFNRRWHMQDGSVRMNPGYQNPDAIRAAGPTDPEVVILVARSKERQPIGVVANYSLHYVGGPFHHSISADYFGYFDRALQRMAGAEFIGIMANGCSGDINNVDATQPAPDMPHPFFQVERVANVLAAQVYSAWQGLRGFEYDDDPCLDVTTEMMAFRRRVATHEELEWARHMIAGPQPDILQYSEDLVEWIYARELIRLEQEPLKWEIPIMAMRVGKLGITGLPGEIFVEYGLQIKKQSPFQHTICIELANDYVGYCPTDKALGEGSYETRLATCAKADVGTESRMVNAALAALRRLVAARAAQ